MVTKICPACGERFERHPSQAAQSTHCSMACRRKHPSRLAQRSENERRRNVRLRAKRRDVGTHTPAEWERVKRLARRRCVKCRKRRALTKDHIIPLSKGGDDRITNIQPLCRPCNSSKQDRVETLL